MHIHCGMRVPLPEKADIVIGTLHSMAMANWVTEKCVHAGCQRTLHTISKLYIWDCLSHALDTLLMKRVVSALHCYGGWNLGKWHHQKPQNISDMEAPIISPSKEFQGNANSKEGCRNVLWDHRFAWLWGWCEYWVVLYIREGAAGLSLQKAWVIMPQHHNFAQ
jgi:hypothetical protein